MHSKHLKLWRKASPLPRCFTKLLVISTYSGGKFFIFNKKTKFPLFHVLEWICITEPVNFSLNKIKQEFRRNLTDYLSIPFERKIKAISTRCESMMWPVVAAALSYPVSPEGWPGIVPPTTESSASHSPVRTPSDLVKAGIGVLSQKEAASGCSTKLTRAPWTRRIAEGLAFLKGSLWSLLAIVDHPKPISPSVHFC